MATRNLACLSVCTRCRPADFPGADIERPGYRLAAALSNGMSVKVGAFGLRGIHCMSQCKRPCVIAFSAPEKFTLIFGDLNSETDQFAVLALARQYAESSDGLIPRSERPECLRAGILGCVPPLDYGGELLVPKFTLPLDEERTI